LSFPIGTTSDQVREVARDVCDQFFQGDGARFDYVAAVHADRAHTHAHIILNRLSPDGEMFFLRSGHRFSYELFREAMVAHGDRYGLRLEATHRLDRGVLTYKAADSEVMRAREQRRAPVERQRIGHALDRAIQDVALAASTYRGLAAEASREGFEEVSEALLRASEVLARNGVILPTREIDMADDRESFDTLIQQFSQNVNLVEQRIATARPDERPRIEQQLNEVLASVAHLNPLGRESITLRESASADGLYSRAAGERDTIDRIGTPRVTAALDAALQGTGIASAEVAARLRIGAPNAALERQWLANDVRSLAARSGLDLAKDADLQRSIDRMDEVHGRLDQALTAALGPRHVQAPERVPTPSLAVAPLLEAEVFERVDTDRMETASLASARRTEALEGERRQQVASLAASRLIESTAARLRDERADAPTFATQEEARTFREVIERTLDGDQLARLAQGDEDGAADLADDRIDRLQLTKAYVEATSGLGSTVRARLVEEVGDEQIDLQRLRHAHTQGGLIHG